MLIRSHGPLNRLFEALRRATSASAMTNRRRANSRATMSVPAEVLESRQLLTGSLMTSNGTTANQTAVVFGGPGTTAVASVLVPTGEVVGGAGGTAVELGGGTVVGGVVGAVVAAGAGVLAGNLTQGMVNEAYNAFLDKPVQAGLTPAFDKVSAYVSDVRTAADAVSKFVPSPVLIPTKIEYGFGTTPKPTMPSQPNLLDAVNKVAKFVAPIATIAAATSPASPLSALLNAVKGNLNAFPFGAAIDTKPASNQSATATKSLTLSAPARSTTATLGGAIAGQLVGQQVNAAMSAQPNLNYRIPANITYSVATVSARPITAAIITVVASRCGWPAAVRSPASLTARPTIIATTS